jgi:hypothetical protein
MPTTAANRADNDPRNERRACLRIVANRRTPTIYSRGPASASSFPRKRESVLNNGHVMRGLLLFTIAFAWSCAKADRSQSRSDVAATVAATSVSARPSPAEPDRQALVELLHAVPSGKPPPTRPDGGTLIGTDTDASARPVASAAPAASVEPVIRAGNLTVQQLSSPILERAAREQIYWQLNRDCRMKTGELPPADSVTLQFVIRSDGTVLPGSVRAEAKDKAHGPVADCVERTFQSSGFRGPTEGRNTTVEVIVTWPSVD